MTVVEPSQNPINGSRFTRNTETALETTVPRQLRLEPMVALEWSQAVEQAGTVGSAQTPADARKAWIHRAPEDQVLALFRRSSSGTVPLPAPWWLRALHRGTLASRADGFRVEDRIAQLLSPRPGWEFVPWALEGESGYWEFIPSEGGTGQHRIPSTLVNTDRHAGWIDLVPAHRGLTAPAPIAVAGLSELRARLGEFETVR